MSESARKRSEDFLQIADQFKLGELVTEASHPVTASLSETASHDVAAALRLLLQVDQDVLHKYREVVQSGRTAHLTDVVAGALRNGGRIFFTGCGSTGRLSILLDSIWRDFWKQAGQSGQVPASLAESMERRTFSVMAGGDFALIKAVEGFEDYVDFGRKQLCDLGVCASDTVFAITEGGETSFVIGTAWEAVEAGAYTCFVYNNPDAVLCRHVQRSREVIEDPRIEKLNLTTGPMAITGSTRMQATTIQLCVLVTVLEMVVRELVGSADQEVPHRFLMGLERLLGGLADVETLGGLAELVQLEANCYRRGGRANYLADGLAIDVLTDTTERSPTFCTPAFRKHGDTAAAESLAFLFMPGRETDAAWQHLLKRAPRCLEWSEDDVAGLVPEDKLSRTCEILTSITKAELMRFRIGKDGMVDRPAREGDHSLAVVTGGKEHVEQVMAGCAAYRTLLFHPESIQRPAEEGKLCVTVPDAGLLLDGLTRVAAKLVLNALSTCVMVCLGRVMGNTMIYVVPSNLKLIDRATRYIARLASLDYVAANNLLFEAIEYVEPRMQAGLAYPPVVGLAVLKATQSLAFEQAEQTLAEGGAKA